MARFRLRKRRCGRSVLGSLRHPPAGAARVMPAPPDNLRDLPRRIGPGQCARRLRHAQQAGTVGRKIGRAVPASHSSLRVGLLESECRHRHRPDSGHCRSDDRRRRAGYGTRIDADADGGQFGDGQGAGAAQHQIGPGVGLGHVLDEGTTRASPPAPGNSAARRPLAPGRPDAAPRGRMAAGQRQMPPAPLG